MTKADRILDIIDGGLQHSTEKDYGTDIHPDRCARCRRNDPVEGGDLCVDCRAFLLDDSDVDPVRPATRFVNTDPHWMRRFTVEFATNTASIQAAFEAMADAMSAAAPAINDLLHQHAQELSDANGNEGV